MSTSTDTSTSETNTPRVGAIQNGDDESGLSGGTVGAIVASVIIVILIAVALGVAYVFIRRKRNQKADSLDIEKSTPVEPEPPKKAPAYEQVGVAVFPHTRRKEMEKRNSAVSNNSGSESTKEKRPSSSDGSSRRPTDPHIKDDIPEKKRFSLFKNNKKSQIDLGGDSPLDHVDSSKMKQIVPTGEPKGQDAEDAEKYYNNSRYAHYAQLRHAMKERRRGATERRSKDFQNNINKGYSKSSKVSKDNDMTMDESGELEFVMDSSA